LHAIATEEKNIYIGFKDIYEYILKSRNKGVALSLIVDQRNPAIVDDTDSRKVRRLHPHKFGSINAVFEFYALSCQG
jgi:hypothetical protein